MILNNRIKEIINNHFGSLNDVPESVINFIADIDKEYETLKNSYIQDNKSELDLIRNNINLNIIFNAFNDIVFKVNRNNIIVDYLAPTDELNIMPHEFIGKELKKFPIIETGKILSEAVEEVRQSGNAVDLDYSLNILWDNYFYAAKVFPISDDNILIIIKNITEEKKKLEVSLLSNEQYKLFAENISDVIWLCDLNMNHEYISPSIKDVTGYTVEAFLNMPIESLVADSSMQIGKEILARELELEKDASVDLGRYRDLVFELKCKDDITRYVEMRFKFLREENTAVKILGIGRDITERILTEKAFFESEKRYRLLAENISDLIWTADMNFNLTYMSPSIKKMLGYTVEEVMSMDDITSMMTPESKESLIAIFIKELEEEKNPNKDASRSINVEVSDYHKKGHIVPLEMRVTFIRNYENEPIGFVGVTRDIAERKAAEKELKQSEEKWRQLFSNIPGGCFTIDQNYKIMDVNRITCEKTGFSKDELIGKDCSLICPKHHEQCPIFVEGKIKVDNYETILSTKDGEEVPIIKSSELISSPDGAFILENFLDITEMKKVEEDLRISKEALQNRNETIEDDLKTAQMIQKGLLDHEFPNFPGLLIDYRYLPLDAVGGDYFSFQPIDKDKLGFFIGDVSSHGVSAALFLSLIKATIDRIFLTYKLNPDQYLSALNDELTDYMPLSFLTALYGFFHVEKDKVIYTFSSAGHPPVVVSKKNNKSTEALKLKGTLIGVFDEILLNCRTVELEKGDMVFLYTDGLPETMNIEKEIIGYEEFNEILSRARKEELSLQDTLNKVIEDTSNYRGDYPIKDDIVIVGFEVL